MKRYIAIFTALMTLIYINVTNVNAASTSFDLRYINGAPSNITTTVISLLQCNNGIDVYVNRLSQGSTIVLSSNGFSQNRIINSIGMHHISIMPTSTNTSVIIKLIPNPNLPASYASGNIQIT